MAEGSAVRLLAAYVVVLVVVLGAVALLGLAVGGTSESPDGTSIDGQSPPPFQPERVNADADPETGTLAVESGSARLLVDDSHGNQFSRADLEPIEEAVFRTGHSLSYPDSTDEKPYNETLAGHEGLLVVQPTQEFTATERAVLRNYTDAGGHVVILGEPTQTRISGGLIASSTVVSFGANNLTSQYGFRMGAETLFNVDDGANDNNFKSIYTTPSGDGPLTEGVDTVTFDTGSYVSVREDSDADVVYTAADGTQTLQTRRTGQYPTVARTENVVFVADASVLERTELYDADNEVFVGNLLSFLAAGDAPDNVPGPELDTDEETTSDSTPTGGSTPTTPTNTTTPTAG
ncbi:motility-associated ABC transporter substrate-binding family protein [Haloarcula amylovorans]|uniref:DUF4350 domain-containing protein n=1 Tax=Haloarcula amylovorans TaxID=2562280 RepID=UPI0010766CF8|nr:DUF4350 domain-containing protein [Halomicroarcula amylolytica]